MFLLLNHKVNAESSMLASTHTSNHTRSHALTITFPFQKVWRSRAASRRTHPTPLHDIHTRTPVAVAKGMRNGKGYGNGMGMVIVKSMSRGVCDSRWVLRSL